MTNLEVAWVLADIAHLLEVNEENIFKIQAYRKAAKVIERLPEDVSLLYAEGRLEQLPGIGKAIAAKVGELVETGRCRFYEQLKEDTPAILKEMVRIPSIGVKSARVIYKHLRPDSLEHLEQLAHERKIRSIPGMGAKTELGIRQGTEMLRRGSEEVTLGAALPLAELLVQQLSAMPELCALDVAGSVRRGREVVKSIDLVAAANEPSLVRETFVKHPQVKEVIASSDDMVSIRTWLGVRVDLHLVPSGEFIPALIHYTGSAAHRHRLQQLAADRDMQLTAQGLCKNGAPVNMKSEADCYRLLGMEYIIPELREDRGEIEAAIDGSLPQVAQPGDIKGDLHIHTRWSDGGNTIEEMALALRDRGYSYMAVTDHSQSLKIAGGLDIKQLRAQRLEIDKLNEKLAPFRILAGVETDILADGSLDYPDAFLKEMDVVIASVHSRFKMEEQEMTRRIVTALRNPWVHFLAHPTGRMLGRRPGYAVDMKALLTAARDYGKALEINASPERLDLSDSNARQAQEQGIPIVINTDSHSLATLGDMQYGMITARRGWLRKESIINTWPLADVLSWLGGK